MPVIEATRNAVAAILKMDPSITANERSHYLGILRNGMTEPTSEPQQPRILRRSEVAKRLSVSTRTVDSLARTGALHRVTLPGRTRAAGFREAELLGLMRL